MEEREKKKALKPKKEKPLTTINVSCCSVCGGGVIGMFTAPLMHPIDALQCLWAEGAHEDKP